MSRKSLEQLRERFKKERENKDNSGKKGYSNNIYPFWDMDLGKKATVRLLPDKNEDNPNVFYVEKMEHVLPINGKNKKIPCLQMYGEKCPICELSRAYYKEEGKESTNGKFYYRKKKSIVRLYVITDPLPPNEETGKTFENSTVNSIFTYQLMQIIKDQIETDEDIVNNPWDIDGGYDLVIKKSPQGKYSTYTIGTGFQTNKSSAVPNDVELIDLSSLLPQNPGLEKVDAMLQAHLSGSEYEDDNHNDEDDEDADDEKPKTSLKPQTQVRQSQPSKANNVPKVQQKDEAEDEDDQDGDDDEDANDILNQIRNRARK